MAGGWQRVTMLIYPEDKEFIRKSTLNYPNIETGGDLFGLWQSESEVVVQLVTGPGENCRRTPTAFFQDKTYLSNVGEYLTTVKGLCNIGEWHSHHCLNLPEPSAGDRATVFRHMPECGLKRFLLIIATITPTGQVNINGYMFTAPERGRRNGGMGPVQTQVLNGLNPFRNHRELAAKLSEGAESLSVPPSPLPLDENDGTPNTESQQPKRGFFTKRPFKRKKSKKYKDSQKTEKKKDSQPTENPKKGKKESNFFRRRQGYSLVSNGGGTSGYFSQSNNQSDPTPAASDDSSNNIGDHHSQYDQTTSRAALIQQRNEFIHQGNHPSAQITAGYQMTSNV